MTRWRVLEIKIDGSTQVAAYREDFAKVFCIPRGKRRPAWATLGRLEAGMPVLCWTEKVVGDIEKIENFATRIYDRAIRQKLDRLQRLGNFNRAANRIAEIIERKGLEDSFNKKMKDKGCERDDPYSRLADYWSRSPNPSADDYKPYFPRDFDDVRRIARVALALEGGRNLGFSASARSILNFLKGKGARGDLRFVRGALIRKAWKRKQIRGFVSREIAMRVSKHPQESQRSEEDEDDDRNLLIAQELNERVLRILQKEGAHKIGIITKAEWRDSPAGGGSSGRGSRVVLRFHPVTRVRRSAISETIESEADNAAGEIATQLNRPITLTLKHDPLTFFNDFAFPERFSLKVLPRSTYQITMDVSEGLTISADGLERTGNETQGWISSTEARSELTIHARGPIGSKIEKKVISATLLLPEDAHRGTWSRGRGRSVLRVRSASDYHLELPPHPSYYIYPDAKATGGPGEREHEFDLIAVSDTVTIPDLNMVTSSGEFKIQGISFPAPEPIFHFSLDDSALRKLLMPQRLLLRDAFLAYVAALCKKCDQCVDMCMQTVSRVERLTGGSSPELARLKDFLTKTKGGQLPVNYRVCLEACKMLQTSVESTQRSPAA